MRSAVLALLMIGLLAATAPVRAELPWAALGNTGPMTDCLEGPKDLDEDLGVLNLPSDYGSYTVENNLYFVNTCGEPLVFWICYPTTGERVYCSNEPYVPPGGPTSSFNPINGDEYYFNACAVGENLCNARSLEWYRANDGARRGTYLGF